MANAQIIDISYCQSQGIDWAKLKAQNIGVIARAGQFIYEDTLFRQHYNNAQAAGVPLGCYWFYQPNAAADVQVQAFLQIYNSLPVKPKVIALDVENIAYTNPDGTKVNILPPSKETHSSWLLSWLSQVEGATGITPGIYTRANYWDVWTVRSPKWAHYWLWVASWTQYTGAVPLMPADWNSWKVWQYEGGTGRVDGVVGPVDKNWFQGEAAAMYEWFGITAPIVTPPSTDLEKRVLALETWAKSLSFKG